jgi:hypothetical protein
VTEEVDTNVYLPTDIDLLRKHIYPNNFFALASQRARGIHMFFEFLLQTYKLDFLRFNQQKI